MYIQITSRCNMECAHCCYSCTATGIDMTVQTFKLACQLAEEYGHYITIGGGEPTIHPNFWEFVGLALGYQDEGQPWLATNGKVTEIALRLARLAKKGVLGVALSRDQYHQAIDERVVDAFTIDKQRNTHSEDFREIRDVTKYNEPTAVGRYREMHPEAEQTECACEDMFVTPLGEIYACGCQLENWGTLWAPLIPYGDEDLWDEYSDQPCSFLRSKEQAACV